MQNFDDLDIEGRHPSHLSEEEREKVKKKKITATHHIEKQIENFYI